jgi:anti-sigma regulatory factor (Ser/Thr protein kinase)
MSTGERRRTFPSAPASASEARRFVESVLAGPDQQSLLYPATLLVSELVANAILHTGTPIEVVIRTTGDQARIEVHDGNPQLPVRKHYSNMSGTGRGLMLVERMATDWGAERTPSGKVVWFEIDGAAAAVYDFLDAEAL